ncbi:MULTISPECIES: superoxide dismutase family protein [unclassified Campylobacter]|uniref:superoxide dismutase family protein n=1 Tax=unclassified Campylobacter TaxID=2593542 RepID=UPI0012382297|nr:MULTISPECIES: superoxide dismutase family protein [unclassified Campylobacter]KAA6224648.1 superoxide dismutase family protein [Campylobacter sp. LR185c]KAA6225648.1 superoxide dismutase family protein [Campylobacter sp. LR286c]KAA6225767.1 superoxide dismutase family protein [Campylobacter sp. LR196d]KAA6229621.1 superoxide dismutase family protein [Campylobacter sp. LR291e]KAA6230134.1 superoxide dismutase family protein [Campylobacter sp. LR264d]
MKKIILASMAVASFLLAANTEVFDPKSVKEHIVIKMDLLGKDGNKAVGEVVAINTKYGVAFFPNLHSLEPGVHGFHVHENGDCGANDKGLGMKAGGHWDPAKTTNHSFTWDDNGHKGDLPALYVDKDGKATNPVLSPKIKNISELKNLSLMVHVGGDNHSDHPAALGGGGARMACGLIK